MPLEKDRPITSVVPRRLQVEDAPNEFPSGAIACSRLRAAANPLAVAARRPFEDEQTRGIGSVRLKLEEDGGDLCAGE